MALEAQFITSLREINAAQWDAMVPEGYPFLQHRFLQGMEDTDCTTAASGWQPCHLLLRDDGDLAGILPLYLKSHSYGEYVFDWSWADAWRQQGLEYYPKLVSAIPFTPATGPRLCAAPGADEKLLWQAAIKAISTFASERGLSSWHILFPSKAISHELRAEGLHQRVSTAFHWYNDGFDNFEDFLATFNSRKRKALKRERRRVEEQGLTLTTLTGNAITAEHWDTFYHFYQMTYAKRSGHGGYLTRAFFTETAASMGEKVILVLAYKDERAVAGALYFRSDDTLYGRYWGCEHEYDCLHFEACYYQGIEYCIANRLQRFDPGAQGEHKIQRGFVPTVTWSNHWIADPTLSNAVGDFTEREARHNADYLESAKALLPFKAND